MKRLLSTEFAVGTFALLGLLVIIYMSLEVNDRNTVGSTGKAYHAYFDSVSGLVRKVPVEVAGISAGFVENIELSGNRARITIRIRGNIPVYANATLTVRDRGILGDRFLMLSSGTSDQRLLADGDEIKMTFSRNDIEQLSQAIAQTTEMVRELLQSDDPRGALGKVIVNLRDMTGRLNQLIGDNEGRLNRILAHVESFSADAAEITSENKEQIRNVLLAFEDVARAMRKSLGEGGSIEQASAKLDRTLTSLENIVGKVERGEGTIGKLINDETTVNNINNAVEGLNDTLGLFRKVQLGVRYRGEFLTSAEEMQNLVGVTLAPSPDKYLLLEFVDSPSGHTSVTDTTVSSGGQPISTTRTVQTDDDVQLTFLLAKRFWDVTLRFGLMRDEGGVGMDYHLLKDRFVVSAEAFDFGRIDNRPHFRTFGTFILYKHLLLSGGVDDVASKVGGKNPFFGAGIQFTDQDLKALVTAIPARF